MWLDYNSLLYSKNFELPQASLHHFLNLVRIWVVFLWRLYMLFIYMMCWHSHVNDLCVAYFKWSRGVCVRCWPGKLKVESSNLAIFYFYFILFFVIFLYFFIHRPASVGLAVAFVAKRRRVHWFISGGLPGQLREALFHKNPLIHLIHKFNCIILKNTFRATNQKFKNYHQ